jgi:hypothetical protein
MIPRKRPNLDHNGLTFFTGLRSLKTYPFIIFFSYSSSESLDRQLLKGILAASAAAMPDKIAF